MTTRNKILLSLVAILLASFTTKVSYAQSVTLGVEFGDYLPGGGDCVGKGVCGAMAAGSGGINVTFQVSADNSNVLIMSFSLSDLKASQPAQVAYFGQGTYPFDGTYSLSGNLFTPLNLPSGAQITPQSNSTVVINGDVITDYITISTGN